MADEPQDFSRYVGRTTSSGTVVVERGPVTNFAASVCDRNPVYRNAEIARAEGFADIPCTADVRLRRPELGEVGGVAARGPDA